MKHKGKTHSLLFTPYLDMDEHLIWVIEDQNARFFHRTYHAISTKRLLRLERYAGFWNRLRSASLILLPECRLHRDDEHSASLYFSPYRIDRFSKEGKVVDYSQSLQTNIENLSHSAAQTLYDLLLAAKEERLEARAKELGLLG